MKCKEMQSLMIEDIFNEINVEEKDSLTKHLKHCSNCSLEYEELKNTTNKLKLWEDRKSDALEIPELTIKTTKKRIFYKIATVAASLLLILSVLNFRLSFNNNGVDISFNLLGITSNTDQIATNILNNGSQVEQLQLMNNLINVSNEQQKQEMVTLLTDFYQAMEMRRQADLKVITQNMETFRDQSNQRIQETEQNMQDLIQYTGSILDKDNYIKSIDKP